MVGYEEYIGRFDIAVNYTAIVEVRDTGELS